MLREITIEGFRGIAQGCLKNFSEINVFIGKNQMGKSTILEAIYMAGYLVTQFDELGRDRVSYIVNRRVRRSHVTYDGLWYQYKTSKPFVIKLYFDEYVLPIHFVMRQYIESYVEINDVMFRRAASDWRGGWYYKGRAVNGWVSTSYHKLAEYMKVDVERLKRTFNYLEKVFLVDSTFSQSFEDIERKIWRKIVINRLDKRIIKIINESYDLDIEDFTYIPWIKENYYLVAKFPHISIRVDELGDGIRYAIAILSAVVTAENTALLIEEPENHQHTGALRHLIHAILLLAKENNLQLFISTHSLETLQALLEFSEKMQVKLRIYHLLLENGKLLGREIDQIDAKLLTDLGYDLRTIYKFW